MQPTKIFAASLLSVATLASAGAARAAPTRADYKLFRALSIDLNGVVPALSDLTQVDSGNFDMPTFVDAHLSGPMYADRLTRIYEDLLRLRIGTAFAPQNGAAQMSGVQILGPDGKPVVVHFRANQLRTRTSRSNNFCLAPSETGIADGSYDTNTLASGATPVDQATFDEYTTLVYPWWLYADYTSAAPLDRYGPAWAQTHPGYLPANDLNFEPPFDPATSALVVQARVCKEEAQTADTATPDPDQMWPDATVSCHGSSGVSASSGCGCGVGLEWCYPGAEYGWGVHLSDQMPLGPDDPMDAQSNLYGPGSTIQLWWAEEVSQLLRYIFTNDLDFREVLTGRYTVVNGPSAQWYRAAQGECCGASGFVAGPSSLAPSFGYTQNQPLFDLANVPENLAPVDYDKWVYVPDRGPLASGILTTPAFLVKFGTRRARAHILYNVFQCRDFVAPSTLQLTPSTEPDLMIRPGCSACHATLEPMAAYFSRIVEGDWTYLPLDYFPQQSPKCGTAAEASGEVCAAFYDPAFVGDASIVQPGNGILRGVYGSPANAELGPAGMAAQLVASPDFAPCVAQNVAQSFLGRPLTADDDALQSQLTSTFVSGGYRMRALVRALLLSDAYAKANNESSTALRGGN